MKNAILALTLIASGCSAAYQAKLDKWAERMGTDTYWANTRSQKNEVHVSEHPVGARDHFGYQKRMVIHNPLNVGIRVHVTCSSIYQADGAYHVNANRVRYVLISGTREFDQTCFLQRYEADNTYVQPEGE